MIDSKIGKIYKLKSEGKGYNFRTGFLLGKDNTAYAHKTMYIYENDYLLYLKKIKVNIVDRNEFRFCQKEHMYQFLYKRKIIFYPVQINFEQFFEEIEA